MSLVPIECLHCPHKNIPASLLSLGVWQPLETAPPGYDGKAFHHVLFRGRSKAGSFSGYAYVSGWMDHNRKPVHEYSYKLIIDAWMELPA